MKIFNFILVIIVAGATNIAHSSELALISPSVVATHEEIDANDSPALGQPDAPVVPFRIGSRQFWLSSFWNQEAGGIQYTKLSGTVARPFHNRVWTRTQSELFSLAPGAQSDGLYWFINLYQHADGLLAFIHVELADGSDNSNGGPGLTRIGIAWSEDDGESFTYLGHIIKRTNDVEDANIQGAPYLIVDGYFYLYYHDTAGISVARAPVDEVINSAKQGQLYPWSKYFNGMWNEPGWGGQSTRIWIDGITHSDAAYSSYTGTYWMALTRMAWWNQDTWVKLWESSDGLNWTQRATVIQQPYYEVGGAYDDSVLVGGYQYLSIVDPSDGIKDGEVGDQLAIFVFKDPSTKDAAGNTANPRTNTLYRFLVDLTNKAQYRLSHDYSVIQGDNNWWYRFDDGTTENDMVWNGNYWKGPEPFSRILSNGNMHPGEYVDTILKWVAPQTGKVSISGVLSDVNGNCGDGVTGNITINGNNLWGASLANRDTGGAGPPLATAVTAGDEISFVLNKNGNNYCDSSWWDPTIRYTDAAWQASTDFSNNQSGQWKYLYGDSSNILDMSFNISNNRWEGPEWFSINGPGGMHPGTDDVRKRWVAPYTGYIRITGTISDTNPNCGDGVEGTMQRNLNNIWGPVQINNGDAIGMSHNLVIFVDAGDDIDFVVNKRGNTYCDSTGWDPSIEYVAP